MIRELAPGEKAMYSLVLFLRKGNGKVRKIVDFMLLNSYCRPWYTGGRNVQRILASIPHKWNIFSVLDLGKGVLSIRDLPSSTSSVCI